MPLEDTSLVDIRKMSAEALHCELDVYIQGLRDMQEAISEFSGVENALDRYMLACIEQVSKRMQDIMLMRGT